MRGREHFPWGLRIWQALTKLHCRVSSSSVPYYSRGAQLRGPEVSLSSFRGGRSHGDLSPAFGAARQGGTGEGPGPGSPLCSLSCPGRPVWLRGEFGVWYADSDGLKREGDGFAHLSGWLAGPATRLTLHGTLFLRESLVLIKRTLGGGEVRGAEGGAGGVDVREPGSWLLAGLFHSATLTRVSSTFSLDLV